MHLIISKYIIEKLLALQGKIDKIAIMFRDFNISFLLINRQKRSKGKKKVFTLRKPKRKKGPKQKYYVK